MSSTLITPESPLLVPPLLAAEIGWESAMILQQIHYFCDRSKHIRPDGRRWFWLTYKGWGQKIPFLKLSTIRRAIDKLRQLKLIDVFRHSQHTWYQANWYTVNLENVKALWLSICQKQQMEVSTTDTSNCSEPANYIRDYSSKINSPQDSAAVEEEVLEVDWDTLENQVEEEQARLASECLVEEEQVMLVSNQEKPVQTTDTLYVDEPEEAGLSNESISHEDNHSAPEQIILHGVLHVPETASPITSDTREDNTDQQNKGWLSSHGVTMRQEEIRSVYNELRQIPCTPAFKLNETVQSVVKKYWENVPGAIAYLKEALRTWKRVESPEKVFVVACKEGRKPESGAVMKSGVTQWYEWARKQRLVIGGHLDKGIVYGLDGEILKLEDMMAKYPKASASAYCVAKPQAATV